MTKKLPTYIKHIYLYTIIIYMTKQKETNILISLPDSVLKVIKKEANKKGRSRKKQIEQVVSDHANFIKDQFDAR